MAGEISYEIFLIHLITMEFAMDYIVGARVYTGSMLYLYVATLVVTIPLAWLLHRFTRAGLSRLVPGGNRRHDRDDEFLDHRPLLVFVAARIGQQRNDHPHHPATAALDDGGIVGS